MRYIPVHKDQAGISLICRQHKRGQGEQEVGEEMVNIYLQ